MRTLLLLAVIGLCPAAEVLLNGTFEQADSEESRRPLGWELPDGLGVRWLTSPDTAHGKVIAMDTRQSERDMDAQWKRMGITRFAIPEAAKNPIAETYGLSLYSVPFPCIPGQAYRLRWSFAGPAGGVKVWVRGYRDAVNGKRSYEAVSEGSARPGPEVHGWRTAEHCFHPTAHTPQVTVLRVMLYAFYPAKDYAFDDVHLEPITPTEYAAYKASDGK